MSKNTFSSHKSIINSDIVTLPTEVYSSRSENEIVLQRKFSSPHLIKSKSTNQKDQKNRCSLCYKHPKYRKTLPVCHHNVLNLLSLKIDEFWHYRQEEVIAKKKLIEYEKSQFDLDEVSDFELN